jgi:hypothetical protein
MAIGIGYPEGSGYPQSTTGNTGSSPIGGPTIPVNNAVTLPLLQSAYDSGTPTQQAAFQASVSGDKSLRPGGTLRRIIAGDSFTAIATAGQLGANLWWVQAQWQLGSSKNTVVALGGRTTAQIAAAIESDIPLGGPMYDEAWALTGQNDLATIASAQTGLAAFDDLIAKLRLRANAIYISGPCNFGNSTTALRDSWLTYHAGLEQRARDTGYFHLIPMNLAYINPSDTNAASDTSLIRPDDSFVFHPSCKGGYRLGSAWAYWYKRLSGVSGAVQRGYAGSAANWRSLTSSARNIFPNPTFTGSGGGTPGAGTVVGTVPSGVDLTIPAGVTATVSIVAQTIPFNARRLKISCTGTLASAGVIQIGKFCSFSGNNVSVANTFVAGAGFEVVVRNGTVNAPYLSFGFYNASYTQLQYTVTGGMPVGAGPMVEMPSGEIWMQGLELAPPAGSTQCLAGVGVDHATGTVDFDMYINMPAILAF